jgi:glutamine synthetase
MVLTLERLGIPCEFHHHEVASGGQCEIDLRYETLTRMADQVMTYKYVVRNVARAHGKTATFMPKPLFGDNGSGMHTHQSLWMKGTPLMADKSGYAGLSLLARQYLGGLLMHAPALLAFCAPTTNSYRRLVPGYEAPVNLVYSQRNRSAAIRIPMYSSSAKAKRIEFRCPDATANPDLAFAAMLMAGIDGVENDLDPGSPADYDLFEDPSGRIAQVPGSLSEALDALESMGIPIEYVHHEVGPSQHEIDMRYASALEMADHTITYRLVVKEIAKKAGYHATFMPKPLFGENGSGMHTHQSLFADGNNAFFDADDEWHLSDVGKAFIAGQLHHAREISAVFAQWVNSYKRLVPGYEAPVYVAWSRRNRSALIRIPLYKPGNEQATRAEIRCPDPACNPYLTFAALLHAGLEGIEKGYDLPPPMEQNLYHLTAEQRRERGIVGLPETLGEAIDELAGSDLVRRALGKHIFDRYVELKRKEWDDYRVQLTPWEMEKYLGVL